MMEKASESEDRKLIAVEKYETISMFFFGFETETMCQRYCVIAPTAAENK